MLQDILASLARIVFGVALAIPILIYPYLYFNQERMIFLPREEGDEQVRGIKRLYPRVREVTIPVGDGVELKGWFHPAAGVGTSAPVVLYFGGNGELASDVLWEVEQFSGWSLLAVDYRGYGRSGGKPGEAALVADALVVHDYLAAMPEVDKEFIVAMGRSLGTGVAVALASKRTLAGVILVTPFDSLRAVAQGLYPFVPISLLIKHPFDSLAKAPVIQTPLLALIAGKDTLTPPEHGWRLAMAWGGPKQVVTLAEVDHDDVDSAKEYWESIRTFLRHCRERAFPKRRS